MAEQGVVPSFKAFWSPLSNYLCLAFMVMIVGVMWMIPGIRASVYAIPVWVLVIWGFYLLSRAKKASQPALR